MASLYYRGDLIWVSFRSPETGQWKRKSTGYRKSNFGEAKQAEKMCDALTLRERTQRPARATDWEWVGPWIESRWQALTLRHYKISWKHLERYLKESRIPGPANLTRDHCLTYVQWRLRAGVSVNTAAVELKLLAQVIDEALARGYCERNTARNLRLKRVPSKEKQPFSDEQLAKLDAVFADGGHCYEFDGQSATVERYGWLHVSYLLGRYQASRIMQARVSLSAIDLAGNVIHWPAAVMKHGKAITQPIDRRFLADLMQIVARRRAAGASTLADMPDMASLHWRKFLDSLGMTNVSHHSLRVRWVSEAAKAGIHEAAAMRFSGHSSSEVHRIYLKLTTADLASQLEKLQ